MVSDLPEGAWTDGIVPCRDPECAASGGIAEPDGDGPEVQFYACRACGYQFGYRQARAQSDTCQIGVPESVRRRAQAVQPAAPVMLQIGKRPDV